MGLGRHLWVDFSVFVLGGVLLLWILCLVPLLVALSFPWAWEGWALKCLAFVLRIFFRLSGFFAMSQYTPCVWSRRGQQCQNYGGASVMLFKVCLQTRYESNLEVGRESLLGLGYNIGRL